MVRREFPALPTQLERMAQTPGGRAEPPNFSNKMVDCPAEMFPVEKFLKEVPEETMRVPAPGEALFDHVSVMVLVRQASPGVCSETS